VRQGGESAPQAIDETTVDVGEVGVRIRPCLCRVVDDLGFEDALQARGEYRLAGKTAIGSRSVPNTAPSRVGITRRANRVNLLGE
jgi:hypothetical protein